MAIPGDRLYLAGQRTSLLQFARGSRHPLGFGWLDDCGALDAGHPVELWITCRMTHVFSLGVLLGQDGAAELAAHGVQSLTGPLQDARSGGWFAAVEGADPHDARPVDTSKAAYGHAFVVLAASSAAAAEVPGASRLLNDALAVSAERFWDDDTGMVVEEWDRDWSRLEDYRGVNANMHTVEAYLAAGDVTGDRLWHERAGRIAARVVTWAAENDWRIPEHFDADWRPLPDYNADRPADPFRPFGATVGHGLEWARLLLSVDASLAQAAPPGLVEAAAALTERAVTDGWAVDGADGFVYTTDWDGSPITRQRMHWVLTEAVNTAACLQAATGDPRWAAWYDLWWAYADRYLVDREHGSWHHELDTDNRPAATVWAGKPDVYHAFQATLVPLLPLTPAMSAGLARQRVAEL